MTNEELLNTTGGAAGLSATLLNAISRGIQTVYDLGKACGTALRMLFSGKKCSL